MILSEIKKVLEVTLYRRIDCGRLKMIL